MPQKKATESKLLSLKASLSPDDGAVEWNPLNYSWPIYKERERGKKRRETKVEPFVEMHCGAR